MVVAAFFVVEECVSPRLFSLQKHTHTHTMFNPFLTRGQAQLLINQEMVKALSTPSIPTIPSISTLHQSAPGSSQMLNSILSQVVFNAFTRR